MATVASLEREARRILERAGVRDPARDAELLLAHALGVGRLRLHLDPDREVEREAGARYRELIGRRARREPLQHLTGTQEFWSLEFQVTPAVLIPRPETEVLVAAFVRLNQRPDPLVIDLGTGSGCLAVAVAHEAPGARVVACDVSDGAIAVARDNARRHGAAGRIEFRRGDLFEALAGCGLEGRADFILSNPPYVAEADLATLDPEVRDHEPRAALVAGADGLGMHRCIAGSCGRYLAPGGHLILEIGAGQEAGVRGLYAGRNDLEIVDFVPDPGGLPRACVVRAPGPGDAVPA